MKHEEECFTQFPNTEKWVEKTRHSRVFSSNIGCVLKSDEILFSFFFKLLTSKDKSSPNFLIIKNTFLNLISRYIDETFK